MNESVAEDNIKRMSFIIFNLKRQVARDIEIMTDGITVWVNTPEGLIGRLGPRGIDVHAKPGSDVHCLDCRRLPENPWESFVGSMEKHHGVTIQKKWQPSWSIKS